MFKMLFFCLCLCFSNAYAAAPLTHVYLSEMWLRQAQELNADTRYAFINGSIFPDIRYLGDIPREKTHISNPTLKQVKNAETAFYSGYTFHSYVDQKREEFVRSYGIYDKLSEVPKENRHTFLKLIEDEILYQNYSWEKSFYSFQQIEIEETHFSIPTDSLIKWHFLMSYYMNTAPSTSLSLLVNTTKEASFVTQETLEEWNNKLVTFSQEPAFLKYVEDLISHFKELIKHP